MTEIFENLEPYRLHIGLAAFAYVCGDFGYRLGRGSGRKEVEEQYKPLLDKIDQIYGKTNGRD